MEGRTRKGSKVSRFWLRHLEQLGHQLKQRLSFSRLVSLGLEKKERERSMHQMQATYGSKELFFCVFFLGSYELLCLLLSAAGMEERKDREWRRMARLHENLGNFGWVFASVSA